MPATDPEQKYAWAKGAAANRMFNVKAQRAAKPSAAAKGWAAEALHCARHCSMSSRIRTPYNCFAEADCMT